MNLYTHDDFTILPQRGRFTADEVVEEWIEHVNEEIERLEAHKALHRESVLREQMHGERSVIAAPNTKGRALELFHAISEDVTRLPIEHWPALTEQGDILRRYFR